jgi:hypothetical protein
MPPPTPDLPLLPLKVEPVASELTCNSVPWSLYGLKFVSCVAHQCFLVNSKLIVVEIAWECPFVTMTVAEMDNSNKRFILY